jgi:hypothetical protein
MASMIWFNEYFGGMEKSLRISDGGLVVCCFRGKEDAWINYLFRGMFM